MRKALLPFAVAALPFFASLEANAANTGALDFAASADPAVEDTKQKKKPKSFVALILENVGWSDDSEQTYIVTAMASPDSTKEKESCPEAEKQNMAKPEGAEEDQKKTLVGPEPLHFAF